MKACILARTAVAELKQAAEMISNQAILINTLPILESQASSEIENIVTTSDRLFEHRQELKNADPATKEALRYSNALLTSFGSLDTRPLTTSTAEQVCSLVKGREMRVRKVPGTALATETGEVVYTPPVGESEIRQLLSNWESFMHGSKQMDPLVRMAVSHYQFEAIHPFTDGNGRTGRILNSLFLIEEQLLTLPILYLSRYIIRSKNRYYELLMTVTKEGRWEDWVLYILHGVTETAAWTRKKIEAIRRLFEHTVSFARDVGGRSYSHELISLIFEQPYCRIQNVVEVGVSGRQAASRNLKKLVEIGVLSELKKGRDKVFVHSKLLRLLTTNQDDFLPYQLNSDQCDS